MFFKQKKWNEISFENEHFISLALLFIVVLGTLARISLLSINELQLDEGLYGDTARHIVKHGDLLLNGVWTDKPPMTFLLQALCTALFGQEDAVVRLSGLIAYWLACGACLVWLRPSLGSLATLLGLAMLSFSPASIIFGASAFTDPLMVAFALASLAALVAESDLASGLLLGLALASKQSAIFYLPIPFFVYVFYPERRKQAKQWAKGFAWIVLPLLLWSAVFAHNHMLWFTVPFSYVNNSLAQPLSEKWGLMRSWSLTVLGGWLGFLILILASVRAFFVQAWKAKGATICAVLLGMALYFSFLLVSGSFFYDRYVLWFLPPLVLLLALSTTELNLVRWKEVTIILFLLVWGIRCSADVKNLSFGQNGRHSGWREAGNWIRARASRGELLACVGQVEGGWDALYYAPSAEGDGLPQMHFDSPEKAFAYFSDTHSKGFIVLQDGEFSTFQTKRAPQWEETGNLAVWEMGDGH